MAVVGSRGLQIAVAVAIVALSIVAVYEMPRAKLLEVPTYYQTTTYLSAFLAGALVAYAYSYRERLPHIAMAIARNPLTAIAAFGALIYILTEHPDYFVWGIDGVSGAIRYQVVAFLLGAILLWVTLNVGGGSVSPLRWQWLRTFGMLSYGTYVFHVLVHRYINMEVWHLGKDLGAIAYHLIFLQYVLASILLAALAYGLIERPAIMMRSKLFPSAESAIDHKWSLPWKIVAMRLFIALAACSAMLSLSAMASLK